MKTALPILATAALAACSAQPPPPRQVAAAAAAGAQDCISTNQIAGRHVLPPNSVMFEVVGPVNYRNDLIGECPGLARLGSTGAIEFENPMGGRLCRNDRIRIFDPIGARATGVRSFPACRLGTFVPVPHG
jgi:hypothetical protein